MRPLARCAGLLAVLWLATPVQAQQRTSVYGKVVSLTHDERGGSYCLFRNEGWQYFTVRIQSPATHRVIGGKPVVVFEEARSNYVLTLLTASHEQVHLDDVVRFSWGGHEIQTFSMITLYNPSSMKTTWYQRVVAVTLAPHDYDGCVAWALVRNGRTQRYQMLYIPPSYKVQQSGHARDVINSLTLKRRDDLSAQRLLTMLCTLNQFVSFYAPDRTWTALRPGPGLTVQLREIPPYDPAFSPW